MANKIQFKRGLKTNLPNSADVGMPLWCTDTKELYIGTGNGVSKVGGTDNSSGSGSSSESTVIINNDVPVITDPLSVLEDDPNYQEYYNNYRYGNELMLKDNQLPEIDDTETFHQILIQLFMKYSYGSVDFGTLYFFNAKTPSISSPGYYNIIYEYDNSIGEWVCGVIEKGYDANGSGGSSN